MANDKRFETGFSTLKRLASSSEIETMQKMKDISPELWDIIVSFGFGDIYSRKGLSLAQREIITLTTLITQGAFDQLEVHIRSALNVGLSQNEIKEIIIQCAAYVGFPKAVQSMAIAGKIFAEAE